MGDVFREDLGLALAEGEEERCSREAECCLRRGGVGVVEEDVEVVFWRVALGLLRWTVAVEDAEEDSGPNDGEGAGGLSG